MFNVDKVTKFLIKEIRNWFDENGKDCKAVIGISGGVDSSVAAALCVEALGKDRVIGVLMPYDKQHDYKDALQIVNYLEIEYYERNIYDIANDFVSIGIGFGKNLIELSEQSLINLLPRIRMSMLYLISQSVNGRVINTCNRSEDYIGFSTKYGDAAGDVSILGGLVKTEVIAIAEYLNLPENLAHKTPEDGLTGKTDEEAFGFTYEVLDRYICTGQIDDKELEKKIKKLHKNNLHKILPIKTFHYFETLKTN